MYRYAFRCKHCLSVVFLDTATECYAWSRDHELYFAFQGQMLCPCNGRFEEMGRVELERDKHGVVIATEERAPCDARCTHAHGPKCTCRCNCANHGSGRVVEVDRVTYRIKASDGVITDDAIAVGVQYARDVEALEAVIERLVGQLRAKWDIKLSMARTRLSLALKKVKESRSLKHRAKMLNVARNYIPVEYAVS